VRHLLLFGGASLLGSLVAALTLHFTILPQMLGSARSTATLGMFTLLFLALVTGILTALRFYRDALERARSDHELKVARRIQSSFLISEFPPMRGLEVHAVNVPSRQVSGDFYDVVSGFGGSHLLALADVAGKGVPAALLTSMLQASLRMQAQDDREVCDMLGRINSLVYRSTEVEQFATFVLARIEEQSMRLSYSNAGHNIPVVFHRDGTRRMLERGGTVVGILEPCAFEEETVQLASGDRVVFYSDGITEASREDGEMFGEERLYQAVERLPRELAARAVTAAILEEVRRFLDGHEPGDDMTVMVLRVLPGGETAPA
jgi:sigma-B regulation protein RsbU (phosphoserine phosphatase)